MNYDIKTNKNEITSKDINRVIEIHKSELNTGFLSSLGDNALRLLFSFANSSKNGILYVIIEKETCNPVGFLLGTINTGAFYKEFLFKKSLRAIIVLLPKLFSFKKIFKIAETLIYPSKKQPVELPETELLDIAILNDYQNNGLGRSLFLQFVMELRNKGINEFKITTGETLKNAQKFYERLGAEKVGEVTVHKGQNTLIYLYNTQKEIECNKYD